MVNPLPVDESIRNVVRLRRVLRQVPPHLRDELVRVEDFLGDSIGLTVAPVYAARALGITQPSLHRWLEEGEITAVMTPEGRREIPLSELVDLVEEVEDTRRQGSKRPLAAVIRDRKRKADASVDINRLLPPRGRTHRAPEMQSLAYHRLVAERLDDEMIAAARTRVENWEQHARVNPVWTAAWRELLNKSKGEIVRTITADSPRARELRQTSPFAGVLTPQERRRLVAAVEGRSY